MPDFSATPPPSWPVRHLADGTPQDAQLEERRLDMKEFSRREVVSADAMPQRTRFGYAALHVLTAGTLDRLRELGPRSRFEPRRIRSSPPPGMDRV